MNAGPQVLPNLPSDRPRRLLLFTAGLQPDDLTLRAFDLARHVQANGRWFARVISMADGPLRADFDAAAIPVQVLDSPDDPASVARQVWGRHQHAAIAFGDAHTQAAQLATLHGWPLLHETEFNRRWFDPYASAERRTEMRTAIGLPASGRLALVFATEARDEPGLRAFLLAVSDGLRECTQADWHLAVVGADGGLTLRTPEGIEIAHAFTPGTVARSAWVAAADAVLDVHTHGTSRRPLLDAAALAVPAVADPVPPLTAFLPAAFLTPAETGSPTDVADALIDLALNPDASARRVASAHVYVMSRLNPARWIPEWIRSLDGARQAWESEDGEARTAHALAQPRTND